MDLLINWKGKRVSNNCVKIQNGVRMTSFVGKDLSYESMGKGLIVKYLWSWFVKYCQRPQIYVKYQS